jgi:hypothetical protein
VLNYWFFLGTKVLVLVVQRPTSPSTWYDPTDDGLFAPVFVICTVAPNKFSVKKTPRRKQDRKTTRRRRLRNFSKLSWKTKGTGTQTTEEWSVIVEVRTGNSRPALSLLGMALRPRKNENNGSNEKGHDPNSLCYSQIIRYCFHS